MGALIGLAQALPISDISDANLGPTATTATVEPTLLDTQLSELQQQRIVKGFNAFLLLDPILGEAIPFEINQRARRALTEVQLNEPVDVDFDMELAEVNLFRPLFRYRAEVARNLGRAPQAG